MEKKRINKYLSEVGFCSRRKADDYISAGRVYINGVKSVLGSKVNIDDEISVDGEIIQYKDKKLFRNYQNFLIQNKITAIKACIGFIKQYNFYDNIVLGIDTFKQFKIFLEIFTKYSNDLDYSLLRSKKSKIILPYLWKK